MGSHIERLKLYDTLQIASYIVIIWLPQKLWSLQLPVLATLCFLLGGVLITIHHIFHLASLLNATVTKTHLQEFEDFSKTALLFSTLAITFSHCFFALALIYHVLPNKWKNICNCIIFYNIRDLKETQQDMELRAVQVQTWHQLQETQHDEDETQHDEDQLQETQHDEDETQHDEDQLQETQHDEDQLQETCDNEDQSHETQDDYIVCERNCHFILAVVVSFILLVILVIVFFYGQYRYHYRLSSHVLDKLQFFIWSYLLKFHTFSH